MTHALDSPSSGGLFSIGGVAIRSMTQDQLIETILAAARGPRQTLITYVNAHCLNVAHRDAAYHSALAEFDIVYPDGMSVVWAGRFLGHHVAERLSAADYFIRLCEEAARRGVALYLLGGYPGVPDAAAAALRARVPSLAIAGFRHGFFEGEAGDERRAADERAAVEAINASGAGLLVCGLSVPVQESWVLRHRAALRPPAVWCVGALFEYIAGHTPRCPRWMARCGLEWLFRLAVEPRRMWRRYLIGNAAFIWRVLHEKFRHRR